MITPWTNDKKEGKVLQSWRCTHMEAVTAQAKPGCQC